MKARRGAVREGLLFEPGDLDVPVHLPDGLTRIIRQNLVDLTPWHVLTRDLAVRRLHGLRERYASRYVP